MSEELFWLIATSRSSKEKICPSSEQHSLELFNLSNLNVDIIIIDLIIH